MPTARLRRHRRPQVFFLTFFSVSLMLNATFYLFGAEADKIYAFPKDKSSNYFAGVRRCTQTPSALLAHREGEIMNYTYILRLSGQNVAFGVGLVLNGVAVSDHRALFSFFDRAVSAALFTRGLLSLGEGGDLWMDPERIASGDSAVQELLNDLSSFWAAEHPVSTRLSAPKLEVKADAARSSEYNVSPEEFLGATMTIPWVFVKRQQTGIPGLGAWTQHVAKHKAEIEGWQAQVRENKKELASIRSGDDFKNSIVSFLLLWGSGFFVFAECDRKNDLEQKDREIAQRDSVINSRDSEINSVRQDLDRVVSQRESYYNQLQEKVSENNRLRSENEDLRQQQRPVVDLSNWHPF